VSQEVAERSCASSPAVGARQRGSRAVAAVADLPRAQQRADRAGPREISADLLAGSRDTILREFYERALADQPPACAA
jgi:hypothetical protein